MNTRRIRRLGGILLMLVWAPVATANALPCGLECALESQSEQHTHHSTPGVLGSHERNGPAVSASHFCQTLQPLSPTFVTPAFPEPPAIDANTSTTAGGIPAHSPSTPSEFDTPPPRTWVVSPTI